MSLRWVPNFLCVLRMLLSVPTAWLILRGEFLMTLLVFCIAAVTDAADGFLAKKFNWQTELGKVLDPLADKLLLITVFVTLAILDLVPLWLAALVVLRDVTITTGAISYRWLYGPIVGAEPTFLSKLNTLVQIIYVASVVSVAAIHSIQSLHLDWPLASLLQFGCWMVVVTTVSSGMDYVLTYSRRAIDAHRVQRVRQDQ